MNITSCNDIGNPDTVCVENETKDFFRKCRQNGQRKLRECDVQQSYKILLRVIRKRLHGSTFWRTLNTVRPLSLLFVAKAQIR